MSDKTNKTKDAIRRFREVHGDRYDYSKVEYVNNRMKVCIICPIHGEFWQTPYKHLCGQGCPDCAGTKKATGETFEAKARLKHGDKYDYSQVVYVNNREKVCIICPEHGPFWQTPHNHLKGQGCPRCAKLKLITDHPTRLGNDKFIERAREIHGDKYDYSHVVYKTNTDEVEIICPIHGPFRQLPSVHLTGCGCQECGKKVRGDKRKVGRDSFIQKAKEIHGDGRYDYSLVPEDMVMRDAVPIICHHLNANGEEHGVFYQAAYHHLGKNYCGCPRCAHYESTAQNEIETYIRSWLPPNTEIIIDDRTILQGQELDIYIPSLKIAIEYNGMIWHSEYTGKDQYYHINKLDKCNEKGISLIQVLEYEYITKKEVVLAKIKHILGNNSNPKIYGRKVYVKEIDHKTASDFMESNHIQGFVGSTLYIGAYNDNKLVGMMSLTKENDEEWNLTRFATDINYQCIGIFGKIFKYFINNYQYQVVKTFADRRWTLTKDNLYSKTGFVLDKVLPPVYRYTRTPIDYIHKFQFRKERLIKKHPNAGLSLDMTETEMATKLGYYKIWDCGLLRYTYRNPNITK